MAGHATEMKNSINKHFSMQPPAGALAPGSIPVGDVYSLASFLSFSFHQSC
jgi:hypothetical protein